MPRTPRSRPRRPRGSLSPDAILDAAEGLAAGGLDAVSMRAVAASLQATPMALYNHFANRKAMIDALLDRVLGRIDPPPPSGDWAADLRAFARAHRAVLDQHPWAIAALFTSPTPGPNATRIGEHALAILRRAGFSSDDAVAAFSGLIALNYGWASFTAGRPTADAERDLGAALRALPVAAFPHTVAVADAMSRYGDERHYALVLDALIAGLSPQRRTRPGGRRRRSTR